MRISILLRSIFIEELSLRSFAANSITSHPHHSTYKQRSDQIVECETHRTSANAIHRLDCVEGTYLSKSGAAGWMLYGHLSEYRLATDSVRYHTIRTINSATRVTTIHSGQRKYQTEIPNPCRQGCGSAIRHVDR